MLPGGSGTSMVPTLAILLIVGSIIVTFLALPNHRLQSPKKTAPKPTPKKTTSTAATPKSDQPSADDLDKPSSPSTRREIDEFDLNFFND